MYLQCLAYIVFGLFGSYLAAPTDNPKYAKILKFDYDNLGKGPYKYGFQSSDGITKEESGEIHHAGTKNEFLKVSGLFAYPGPDGVMYEVRYTADDQGFHPEGDHFKVPPFVPWINQHDDETNDIGDALQDNEGDYNSDFSSTIKPSTDYQPSSSTTYLPASSSTVVTPTEYIQRDDDNVKDEPITPCEKEVNCFEPEQEGYSSVPNIKTSYLPTSSKSLDSMDDLVNNLLSTPEPKPDLHFHSSAES